MKFLFDPHCHVMSLARPALAPFMDALGQRKGEAIFAQVASPGYLLMSFFRRGGSAARNLLSVVESDPAAVFMLIEDDLAGRYSEPGGPAPAPLSDAKGYWCIGSHWDAWCLCPLVMDFGRPVPGLAPGYYPSMPAKSLEEGVREILAGIQGYRRARPRGRLVVRPFLGLDPGFRGPAATEELLHRYFSGYKRNARVQLAAFKALSRWGGDPWAPPANAFAGVKLYPPLGFEPWPGDARGRDAVRELYSYCQRRRIPITVHCDDQGYRSVPIERAMHATDPARWLSVLREYPELIVNFAHFGERYLPPPRGERKDSWTMAIVSLMERYPGVYADVSFNGSEVEYWDRLAAFIDALPAESAAAVRSRLMYGTDFFINLTKSRSYLDYAHGFLRSPLDDELKRSMLHDAPQRFLME
jgi:hypothetical protein